MSEQLREAIEASGMSRYEIAKSAAIDESALGKFFHGERGLSLKALDRLAEFLDLELRPRQLRPGRRTTKKRG